MRGRRANNRQCIRTRRQGLLFPGDPGVPAGIAAGRLSRVHAARRAGLGSVRRQQDHRAGGLRHLLRRFYQRHGRAAAGAISALPWTQAYQLPGPGFNLANPYGSRPPRSEPTTSLRPRPCSRCNRECCRLIRRTGISRSSGPSPRTICSTFAMWATKAPTCRASSKPIHLSMGLA